MLRSFSVRRGAHLNKNFTIGSKSIRRRDIQKRHNSHVVKSSRPFRMAVIGSGPAGFYTAYKVMSSIKDAKIDMYEHLPVPFGLVRFGVAPDHPEVKNCQEKFTEVASSPNFNFIGNVDVGRGLALGTLKDHYNAILFAYGASEDRKLGIQGEDKLSGVYSARDFVGWYNGLPERANLDPDLSSGDTALIIGQGNVALDVARVLLTDIDVLRKTDMTDHALATLAQNKVKHIHVIGRRGPMQASFTIKEVRELLHLPNVAFSRIQSSLLPPKEIKISRTPRRMISLLREGSRTPQSLARKSWSLDFMLSPCRFVGGEDGSQLKKVDFIRNKFQDHDERFDSSARVKATGEDATSMLTSLAFRSIGYKSVPIHGMRDLNIYFDDRRGIIPNDHHGRITSAASFTDDCQPSGLLPGMYCTGWVKRGPAGVIANTMEDAFATAEAITIDWENKKPFLPGGCGWDSLCGQEKLQGLRPVSWYDWLKIDAAEKNRGKLKGKEREKFASIPEMLAVLD